MFQDYINTLRALQQEDLEQSGCMFLALKTIISKPASYFINQDKSKDVLVFDPTFVLKQKELTSSGRKLSVGELQIKSLFNMVSHEDESGDEEKIRTAIRSAILLQCLKFTKYLDGDVHDDLFLWLLYHFQYTIMYSVLSIYKVDSEVRNDVPLAMIGSGIYDDMILMNHSCCANTTRFFQDGSAILVTKRSVSKGEEISLNYGIHHNNMPMDKRKLSLKKSYKFDCTCEACQRNFPTLNVQDKEIKARPLSKKLDRLLNNYKQSYSNGRLVDAKNFCVKYLQALATSGVSYPHKSYEIGAIALNSCWWGIISANQMNNS